MAFKFLLWSFRLQSLKSFYSLLLMVHLSIVVFLLYTNRYNKKTPLLWVSYLKVSERPDVTFFFFFQIGYL